MSNKIVGVIIILLMFLGLSLFNKNVVHQQKTVNTIDTIEKNIDSIKIINDTIKVQITKYKIKLVKSDEQYKENVNVILNQSVDSDYKFFTEYLSGYFNKNNSDTIKTN